MKPYFILLEHHIPWYGIFWFLGIFVSAIFALLIIPKDKIHRYDIVYSAVYTMIAGTIGSKVLFILISIEQIIELKIPIENLIKGGFVFYGGLIGGTIGLLIYCKQFKLNFVDFADIYAVVLPLGHALGRIGCLVSGCCYGLPYNGPFHIEYTASFGITPLNTPLFPIQLVESLILGVLFIIFLIIYKKVQRGIILTLYMIFYPIFRFILEYFRGDDARGHLLNLSTSQWISIAILISGIIVFYNLRMKNKC